jgi:hypothetical protein
MMGPYSKTCLSEGFSNVELSLYSVIFSDTRGIHNFSFVSSLYSRPPLSPCSLRSCQVSVILPARLLYVVRQSNLAPCFQESFSISFTAKRQAPGPLFIPAWWLQERPFSCQGTRRNISFFCLAAATNLLSCCQDYSPPAPYSCCQSFHLYPTILLTDAPYPLLLTARP